MRILVFGFEKFGELTSNPAQLVVEELARESQSEPSYQLITCVLPTEYAASEEALEKLLRESNPMIVVGLGVSTSRQTISLERFALNIDDVNVADNAGCVRLGEEIEPNGVAALMTSVDLLPILKKLTDHGIPATISNHAGTYVCNHVYYQALRTLQSTKSSAQCVFVHLPGLDNAEGTSANTETVPVWTMQTLLKAAKLVVEGLFNVQE